MIICGAGAIPRVLAHGYAPSLDAANHQEQHEGIFHRCQSEPLEYT